MVEFCDVSPGCWLVPDHAGPGRIGREKCRTCGGHGYSIDPEEQVRGESTVTCSDCGGTGRAA